MIFFQWNIAAIFVGFILDMLIGDPQGWPHPVILIGRYIAFAEKKLRARGGNLRRSAIVLTGSTVFISMAASAAVLFVLHLLGKIPLFIGMCIMSWQALSAKCLAKEGRGVAKALGTSLESGRKQVARIVGRDTSELSETEIIKATIETVAENTTDGVIAPMLYLLIGGPVLAAGFKAASTLDSMVGYMDEKYRDIGWSSAKLDDALNWIPARLTGALMCICAFAVKLDGRNAFRIMHRDHANHLSPNCAWSEAATAGALHVQLGGTHTYFGKTVEKPTIGDDDRPVSMVDINRTSRLMYASEMLLMALMLVTLMLVTGVLL